jgi:hypothetical protein
MFSNVEPTTVPHHLSVAGAPNRSQWGNCTPSQAMREQWLHPHACGARRCRPGRDILRRGAGAADRDRSAEPNHAVSFPVKVKVKRSVHRMPAELLFPCPDEGCGPDHHVYCVGKMVGTGFGASALLAACPSARWRRGRGFEPPIRSPVQRTWMRLPKPHAARSCLIW